MKTRLTTHIKNSGVSIRAIAESAILLDITLVLIAIKTFIPIISPVLNFLCPAPLTAIGLKFGFKWNTITCFVGMFLATALGGPGRGLQMIWFMLISYYLIAMFSFRIPTLLTVIGGIVTLSTIMFAIGYFNPAIFGLNSSLLVSMIINQDPGAIAILVFFVSLSSLLAAGYVLASQYLLRRLGYIFPTSVTSAIVAGTR